MSTPELTKRQAEIKEQLDQNRSALEIADKLGITRNAVYQQISSLRRKGALAANFTPSGGPLRGMADAGPGNGDSVVITLMRAVHEHIASIERECAELRRKLDG